jgi:hypothetical protein
MKEKILKSHQVELYFQLSNIFILKCSKMKETENIESLNNSIKIKVTPINTKYKINLSPLELFCPSFYNSKNMNLLKAASSKLNKHSSINYILRKLIEFDKVKLILFNEKELEIFNMLDNPSLGEGKCEDKYIQTLWQKLDVLEDKKRAEKNITQKDVNNKDEGNYMRKIKVLL